MSRCFPFPPPGYVKKARADDVDLVKKEKEREKKYKKERRDKEKREGKERKEKDRTEGKHRDKKEKKDRHSDKRKDREKDKEKEKEKERDRDREKDRGGTSEERRISEQQTDGRNSKERRIVNKDRPPAQIPGTSGQMDKERNRTHIPDARSVDGISARGGSAPKSLEKNQNFQNNHNNHAVHNSADAKFVLELGKRVRDEVGVTTQSGEKITVVDRKDDGVVRLVNAMPGPSPDKMEKSQDRKGGDRRSSGPGLKDERKTVTSQNSSSVPVPISEGMPRPPKTSIEEKMAGREKIQDKEGEQMGANKLILLDPQKCKTPVKDKDRSRERRKDERIKKVENKVCEEEKLRERTKDSIDAAAANDIVFHVLEEVNKIDQSAGNDKKRKNLEPNGFLRENEARQIKLPRLSSLSDPSSVENGRILDAPRNANRHLLDKQRKPDVVNAVKPKDHKPNGIRETKSDLFSSSLDAASLELLVEKQMTRSPHPDLKYLDEVLTVPKFEELVPSEDDQEWLYGSHHAMKKPREMSSSIEIKETPQPVWSEAVSLGSADIVALPYVVPF